MKDDDSVFAVDNNQMHQLFRTSVKITLLDIAFPFSKLEKITKIGGGSR